MSRRSQAPILAVESSAEILSIAVTSCWLDSSSSRMVSLTPDSTAWSGDSIPSARRSRRSAPGQARVRNLAQVQDRLVVSKKHRLQPGFAIEAQAADHGPVEVADEPVGQEERPRPLVRDLPELLLARVHLVAVRSAQP